PARTHSGIRWGGGGRTGTAHRIPCLEPPLRGHAASRPPSNGLRAPEAGRKPPAPTCGRDRVRGERLISDQTLEPTRLGISTSSPSREPRGRPLANSKPPRV